MDALRRFEHWVATTLEDSLALVFGGKLEAPDLARRLATEMADRRRPGAGRIYVPNRFVVNLSPWAAAELARGGEQTEAELAAFLIARAAEEGDSFVGRVVVQLKTDPALRRRRTRIESAFSNVADASPAADGAVGQGPFEWHGQTTMPLPSARPAATRQALVLVVGERRMPVRGEQPFHLGRALDNDLVLDHPSVSRRHARLSAVGNAWEVEDLGSAAGVVLNGRRVRRAALRAGDTLRLGLIDLHLEGER